MPLHGCWWPHVLMRQRRVLVSHQLSGHLKAIPHPTAFPCLEYWLKCAPAGEARVSNLCHVAVVADRQLPHFGNNFV